MKLISNFHDYYDIGLAEGRDESIVYVRKRDEESISLPADMLPWTTKSSQAKYTVGVNGFGIHDKNSLGSCWEHWSYEEAFLVVAGKAHPVWVQPGRLSSLLEIEKIDQSKNTVPLGEVDRDVLLERLKTYQKEFKMLLPHKKESDFLVRDRLRGDDLRVYETARTKFLERDFSSLHIDSGAPVLLIGSPRTLCKREEINPKRRNTNVVVVKNPNLGVFGFQRIKHPFTCFQEISQFIGGVVPGNQMPMVTISDKSKILKKGFDPKYGFRTRPKK